jgi:hypothetical protein
MHNLNASWRAHHHASLVSATYEEILRRSHDCQRHYYYDDVDDHHDHHDTDSNKEKKDVMNKSFSDIAGNLSFICVTLAYINTDIFWLRGLVMGSISLSILFQFYRLQPLWISICCYSQLTP